MAWLDVRTKYEPSAMKHAVASIYGHPDQVMEKYYFQKLQQIVAAGADIQREYLNSRPNYTKTGQKRKAAGGNGPGRIDTGTMKDGIKWSSQKTAKGRYDFKFGWINGTPGYSIFQEYGTANGIQGMGSLAYALEFVRKEIKYLNNGGKGTTTRSAAKPNFDGGE